MKIIEQILLLGESSKQSKLVIKELEEVLCDYHLKLNPTKHGNGVKPIREGFVKALLKKSGWIKEHGMEIPGMKKKPLDGYKKIGKLRIGLEWETGNVSSSFRALLKLISGLHNDQLDIAIHVLPSKAMYKFLTDRVGNVEELRPYFPIFKLIKINENKTLIILVVEHDEEDINSKLIKKGLDGMSLKRRKS